MSLKRIIAASLLVLGLVTGPVRAAEEQRPYDNQLLRLAELLGAVHYLRELCGAKEGQIWREKMEALVEAEGTSALRRAKLVQSFNKGYRSYRRTYQTCTKSAETAVTRFLAEGAEIADAVSASGT
ncbi:MAG: TIGR02301 family protein [Hyphomicrobiaceae bacterium]